MVSKLAFAKNLIDANSYFSTYKSDLEKPRSRFDRSSSIKTSFNVGDLVPFSTLQTIYNKGDKLNNIIFTTKNLTSEEANKTFEIRIS